MKNPPKKTSRPSCKIEGWRTAKTCSYRWKTVPQPAGLSESENASWSPCSPLNQNVIANGAASSSANSKTVRVKLPKLEVRKFSGKLEEWQEFWDSFESAIHSNDSLSSMDKFSYLRGLLLEPATSAIAGFALTSVNRDNGIDIPEAWMPTITHDNRSLPNRTTEGLVSSSHNTKNAFDRKTPTMSEVCDTPITNNHSCTNSLTQ